MTKVNAACADCLEKAGGRQNAHRVPWRLGICGACGKRKVITEPKYFGNPPVQPSVLEDVF
jgi:hypothetical protein